MSSPPVTPSSEYRRREQSITLSPLGEQLEQQSHDGERTQELLTLNFGPHHPATHGVLRLLVTLQGEVVHDIKPIVGYVHTGIEKTAEDKSYWKVIPVIERMDYLAYHFNSLAYIGAVEKLAEVVVPTRAEYLRVIHMELNRIMSHLVWLGTSALDLGAISMFWYCFREREQILDLFESSTGQRMHTRYFQIGGVAEDIPVGWAQKLRGFVKRMPESLDQYGAILNSNEIILRRLRGTCALDAQTLLSLGVTGPLLRAAGNPWDLRKAQPYSSLRGLRLQDPGGNGGRQLRPLRGAHGGDVRVGEDHRPGAGGPAGGPVHHDGPQGRAAAAPRAGDIDGGADPPLQARHGGPARAAGRVLQPDRGAARRARLLRALGRLVEAGARAHARSVVRQPAGLLTDGRGLLHRRHDRHAGDARPDFGRDR